MFGKKIIAGQEVFDRVSAGVRRVADVVGITIGPYGKNVLLHRKNRQSEIINDGATIAAEVALDDEVENAAAQRIIDAAQKTARVAGDGTTTCVILAEGIFNECAKKISEDARSFKKVKASSVLGILNEIREAKEKTVAALKEMAKPVKTEKQLIDIAVTAMEDKEIGEAIGKMVFGLGRDCSLVVEEGYQDRIETESLRGMRFFSGYGGDFFKLTPRKQIAMNGVPILVTNYEFFGKDSVAQFSSFVNRHLQLSPPEEKRKGLAIFAWKFGIEVLKLIEDNVKNFQILPIRSQFMSAYQYDDLALFTDARMIDKERGMKLEDFSINDLGYAEQVIAENYHTAIIGGRGAADKVAAKVEELRAGLKESASISEHNRLEKRIAGLAGGFGKIKIGAATETEKKYMLRKAEDAIYASRCALEEGFIPGGGLALKEISEKLPKNILTPVLSLPYWKIQENAGGDLTIPKDVFDSAKVARVALENACSVAGVLLTTGAAIVYKNDEVEVLRKLINREIELPSDDDVLPEHMREQMEAQK